MRWLSRLAQREWRPSVAAVVGLALALGLAAVAVPRRQRTVTVTGESAGRGASGATRRSGPVGSASGGGEGGATGTTGAGGSAVVAGEGGSESAGAGGGTATGGAGGAARCMTSILSCSRCQAARSEFCERVGMRKRSSTGTVNIVGRLAAGIDERIGETGS